MLAAHHAFSGRTSLQDLGRLLTYSMLLQHILDACNFSSPFDLPVASVYAFVWAILCVWWGGATRWAKAA